MVNFFSPFFFVRTAVPESQLPLTATPWRVCAPLWPLVDRDMLPLRECKWLSCPLHHWDKQHSHEHAHLCALSSECPSSLLHHQRHWVRSALVTELLTSQNPNSLGCVLFVYFFFGLIVVFLISSFLVDHNCACLETSRRWALSRRETTVGWSFRGC